MSEMMIRRNNRGIPVARYPAAGKAEKTQDSAPAQKTTRTGGVTVSDTLRQLMQRVSQTGQQVHKSRQTLQVGEAVLTEVQESLERIGELAQEANLNGTPLLYSSVLLVGEFCAALRQ